MPVNTRSPLAAFLLVPASALIAGAVAAQSLEPSMHAFVESLESPAPIHASPVIPRAFIPLSPDAERAISGAHPTGVSFFRGLEAAAVAAKSAEADFRQAAAARIAALEQERAFAFRRMNLMQAVVASVHSAESEETAVANALAMLRARLAWDSDTELRTAVSARFGPVALAAFRVVAPGRDEPVADIGEQLAAFETWYAETWNATFWSLFANPMRDTPLVDF